MICYGEWISGSGLKSICSLDYDNTRDKIRLTCGGDFRIYGDPSNKMDGQWHFVVGVWENGNTVKFYYDNECIGTKTGTYSTLKGPLEIGHGRICERYR